MKDLILKFISSKIVCEGCRPNSSDSELGAVVDSF